MPSPMVSKWQDWLRILNDEVSTLFLHRDIWNKMATTIDRNPNIPRSYTLNFFHAAYTVSQAVAVRRLADPRRDVVSFVRLLTEIKLNPGELTARQALPPERANEYPAWEIRYAGGKKGGHVDPSLVGGQLTTLETKVGPIQKYVNTHAAHLGLKPLATMPTYKDLNVAIDYFGELSRECDLLLHHADRRVMPVVLDDLMAPFRVPWLS